VIVWRDVFLGIIAVATLAIAVAQIAVIIAAAAAAKRVGQLADQFEREVKPLFGHLNAIGRDAARAAQLASAQVERADKLFVRIDDTLNLVQSSVLAPAREGRALLSAVRAAFHAVRELRQARARQARSEDEDALFI
jgi:hypothetical protein